MAKFKKRIICETAAHMRATGSLFNRQFRRAFEINSAMKRAVIAALQQAVLVFSPIRRIYVKRLDV